MERKLATVLFVDLVDSTGLVVGSDPDREVEETRWKAAQVLRLLGVER